MQNVRFLNMTQYNNPSFFKFIHDNKNVDSKSLLLKHHGKMMGFPLEFAVVQIESRKKTESKLPYFLSFDKFIFPDKISAEQSSDQRVAKYHASLVGRGQHILDMTSGLGIDAMSMAMADNYVTACELDKNKHDALIHNSSIIELSGFTPVNCNSVEFIRNSSESFDIIFIDPARRDINNKRTYSFNDCIPDVTSCISDMKSRSKRIFIKASPLLDVTKVRDEIDCISKLHLVCVKGECKELLVEIDNSECFKGIRVVDLNDDGMISDIFFDEAELRHGLFTFASKSDLAVGKYLYEPNAGVMKLNPAKALCDRYNGLKKLARNTSLYISDILYDNFPGRISIIENIPDNEALKSMKGEKYNVVSRNYPLTADELRKKYRIKEGKDKFLYAFRMTENSIPQLCLTQRI